MKREDIVVGGVYKCKNTESWFLVKDRMFVDRRHTRRTVTCKQVCQIKNSPGVFSYTGTTISLGLVQFSKWATEKVEDRDPKLGDIK